MRYIAPLLLLAFMALVITIGVNKQEVAECLTWQAQAKEYNSFYLTTWQEQQCLSHDVIVPIKR